jgi:hypothetical protein
MGPRSASEPSTCLRGPRNRCLPVMAAVDDLGCRELLGSSGTISAQPLMFPCSEAGPALFYAPS